MQAYAVSRLDEDAELDQLLVLLSKLRRTTTANRPAYGGLGLEGRQLRLLEGRHEPSFVPQVTNTLLN